MQTNRWDKKEETQADFDDLKCSAHGCINNWSVQIEGRLCSDHAWADPKTWPQITGSQFYVSKKVEPAPHVKKLLDQEKKEIINDLRSMMNKTVDSKAWAYTLKNREESGEILSSVQKEAWRNVCC